GSGNVTNGAADCGPAIANGSNQPINGHLLVNPNPHFIGVANADLEFLPSEPNYYRLVSDAPGVDAGNGAAPNSTVDFTGVNDRVTDGIPDIGAFELVPLQAEPVAVNRAEDTFNQLGDIPAVPAAGQ